MDTIEVHELEKTGAVHQQVDSALVLLGKQQSASTARIIIEQVAWWERCAFGIQNVLSSLDSYRGNSLTDVLILMHDIADRYRQSVRDGQHRLFVLNERVGLSGWVIAHRVQVEADE